MLLSLEDLCLSLGVDRSHLLPKDTVTQAEGMQILFADFKAFHKAVGIISLIFSLFLCVYLVTGSERRGHSLPGSPVQSVPLSPCAQGGLVGVAAVCTWLGINDFSCPIFLLLRD